jgi:hydroxyquinol 1,2-dioxygenase
MDADKENGYFTESDSAEVVISRNRNATDLRFKAIMESIVTHLHAVVKEVEPTQDEWFAAINFLTETGHMCDDWRQEYILLSDVLGVSMLVDAINNRKPTGATETTVLGPFHSQDTPTMENGANICLDAKGESLVVHGVVKNVAGEIVSGARLDVWQANDEGFYDMQQKGIQPEFNLRGIFESQSDGGYWFRGVKPRHYAIPSDGPVGQMLGKLDRHPNRPAHLHFIVSNDGYEDITTHIFVPDDPYIDSDAVFGVKESLLADFVRVDDQARADEFGVSNPFWEVEFDFVMNPVSAEK